MECWAPIFNLTCGSTRTAELSSLFAGHALPPKEILWYSFFMEAEWTPGILDMDRRNKIWNQTRNLLSCGALPQPTAPLLATRSHIQSPSMSLRRVRQQNRLLCNWATCKAMCTVHFHFFHRRGIRSCSIAHGSNASSCTGIDI